MVAIRKKLVVKNAQGLHARPAAVFVRTANKFDSKITIRKGEEEVNGKSIMGILMLGAEKGDSIYLEASGEDAQEALRELEELITKDE